MFKQGTNPTIVISRKKMVKLNSVLFKAGYIRLERSIKRKREKSTWRRIYNNKKRQIHVQVCESECRNYLEIFAHTETITEKIIFHGMSALLDQHDFCSGSRMIRNDLRKAGLKFK